MEFQSSVVRPVGSIEDGWTIIKNDYWTFFGMTVITIIILIVASFILGLINNGITFGIPAVFGVATNNAGDAAKISAAIIPQLISMVISVFTNIIVGAISGAFFCGIYKSLSRAANGGAADFNDIFAGFQKIQSCFVVATVLSAVQFVLSLILLLGGAAFGVSAFGIGMLTKNGQINPSVLGGLFLVILVLALIFIVVNLIVSALTTFAYPLIADRNLSGGQALLLSIKGGFANIGGIILLMILLGLITIGGMLACFVGILFVAPLLIASVFAAYRSVFGTTGDFYQQSPPQPPTFNNQQGYQNPF